MSWFTLALCSVTALAGAELAQQHLLTRSKPVDPRTSAVLTFLLQALLTIPMLLNAGLSGEFLAVLDPTIIPWFLLVAGLGSVAMVLYLRSFKVQSISFSCIFISWSAVVSTALGIMLLDESFEQRKIVGILLVLIAIALLHVRNTRLEKNHLYALAAGSLFGLTFTLDKTILLAGVHPVVYMFWIFLSVAVLGTLQDIRGMRLAIRGLEPAQVKGIALSAMGYFAFNFCTFSAYTHGGEVGRVDAINNSQVFLILLVEYFVFKQRDGALRKIAAAALAIAGVVLLGR